MKTVKLTELSNRASELMRDARAGELSVITQDGEPAFIAVPFDKQMEQDGLGVSLAVKLFDDDAITQGEAAKMARMSLAEFMEACSARGVPVVRYSPAELEMEIANVRRVADR